MKKRILSAFVAGVTASMFGVLYPEYILLPDTYQYITEKNSQTVGSAKKEEMGTETELYRMLHADPDQVVVSSRLWQLLTDEGIVLWKNNNADKVDM